MSFKDPRVKDFLLMSNPFPTIAILTVYLYFILKWGPNYMRDRKPFNLDTLMIVYNIIQIIACCLLLKQAWTHAYAKGYSLFCEPVDFSMNPDSIEVARGCHAYFLLKIADLLDTVFFVLRKKDNQVSFLHMYHHTGMVALTWTATKFLPGGEQGILLGFLNSFVHIFMYFYYMVAAMGPKYRKFLWWKKYMTWIQLIQFTIMLTYLVLLVALDCKFSRALTFFFVGNVVIFLYLFSRFYAQAYDSKKASAAKALDQNQNGHMIDRNINIKQD
ncbi:hypothetical protein HA402_006269 [Bradysia odoriphaga]|nr:hypothetical protein HA402_006269 [Bradysia odoriphaga]